MYIALYYDTLCSEWKVQAVMKWWALKAHDTTLSDTDSDRSDLFGGVCTALSNVKPGTSNSNTTKIIISPWDRAGSMHDWLADRTTDQQYPLHVVQWLWAMLEERQWERKKSAPKKRRRRNVLRMEISGVGEKLRLKVWSFICMSVHLQCMCKHAESVFMPEGNISRYAVNTDNRQSLSLP